MLDKTQLFQQELNSETAVIILDYDNLFYKPLSEYTDGDLELFFINLVKETSKINDSVTQFKVRLYGGWYDESGFTQLASNLAARLASVNIFPYIDIKKRINIKGTISLATTIFSLPNVVWQPTYKIKKGVRGIRLNREKLDELCTESNCQIRSSCSLFKTKQKLCPMEGCSIRNHEVIWQGAQKMVDNMIACDILAFAGNSNAKLINVVSDDIDHIPSLLQASILTSQNKNSLILSMTNYQSIAEFDSILNQFKINTVQLS